MYIKITEEAVQFNCHWYCTKVGRTYKTTTRNLVNGCYAVADPETGTTAQQFLVNPKHTVFMSALGLEEHFDTEKGMPNYFM